MPVRRAADAVSTRAVRTREPTRASRPPGLCGMIGDQLPSSPSELKGGLLGPLMGAARRAASNRVMRGGRAARRTGAVAGISLPVKAGDCYRSAAALRNVGRQRTGAALPADARASSCPVWYATGCQHRSIGWTRTARATAAAPSRSSSTTRDGLVSRRPIRGMRFGAALCELARIGRQERRGRGRGASGVAWSHR